MNGSAIPQPALGFVDARRRVEEAGFGSDITWAEGLALVQPDPVYVTRETAWVILNSGFRFAVARKLWPALTRAFLDWAPELITDACIDGGLAVLNHPGKIRAMREIAGLVHADGIEPILRDAREPRRLRRLPWIGSITCYHLAKVLGADVVKPDVHLVRAATAAGFKTALELCEAVRVQLGGLRLAVIDSVFWRYGEQRLARGWPGWAELFAIGT